MIHLPPAAYAILVFGDCSKLARALGMYPSTIWRWWHRAGARIPARDQCAVLSAAKERGLDLIAEDLIQGRAVDDSPRARLLLEMTISRGQQIAETVIMRVPRVLQHR